MFRDSKFAMHQALHAPTAARSCTAGGAVLAVYACDAVHLLRLLRHVHFRWEERCTGTVRGLSSNLEHERAHAGI